MQHGVVVLAEPGKTLRLHGSLGPLQEMGASGALTWALESTTATETSASVTYAVAAYVPGGADKLAAVVDSVMAEQIRRLKAYAER